MCNKFPVKIMTLYPNLLRLFFSCTKSYNYNLKIILDKKCLPAVSQYMYTHKHRFEITYHKQLSHTYYTMTFFVTVIICKYYQIIQYVLNFYSVYEKAKQT